ncbi:MAG: 2-oxoacid:ferredoxin oxidoreductase subunit beta [Anaerolineaceae bacterium]|nr:2-oxoacid:ferredoxin oxidoreductase subunit beta [Anaerolineaceae bacterium]
MGNFSRDTKTNAIGLTREDYRGAPSTLCKGCGHNAIAAQIIAACYALNISPEDVVKFSGIGCSSKCPTYFLSRSFGFNGLHGRMPSLATGALFADTSLIGIGLSGDGDSASIGMGQFKHVCRRNLPLVYIIANNGVYGLTKGQFSPTAEKNLELKRQGKNPYLPVDICMEAMAANATFVARAFAGDPKQLRELIKAALNHNGTAVIDVISPCVTFHNLDQSIHSYAWGKKHERQIHEISFIPDREEIVIDEFEEGTVKEIELHDGTSILIKKIGGDYDPTNRFQAFIMLEDAEINNLLLTGLIYLDTKQEPMYESFNLPDAALNRLPNEKLRPADETLEMVNSWML